MRIIDADAFLEALENADADVCETYPDFYCDWGFSQKAIEGLLLNIPTIEAKPVVHGEWIKQEDYCDDEYFECSSCKEHFYFLTGTPESNGYLFCPNCGMDMRERIENDN